MIGTRYMRRSISDLSVDWFTLRGTRYDTLENRKDMMTALELLRRVADRLDEQIAKGGKVNG